MNPLSQLPRKWRRRIKRFIPLEVLAYRSTYKAHLKYGDPRREACSMAWLDARTVRRGLW